MEEKHKEDYEYKLFLGKYPENAEFDRVHAVLVTHDGRVLLRYKNGEARTTGGHIDPEDTDMEAALKREILEEINCKIDKCDYLGYLEVDAKEYYDSIGVDKENVPEKEYWARMVARVSEILPPQPDPDRAEKWVYGRVLAPREIAEIEMTKIEVFGMNNGKVLDAAYRMAREKEYFTEVPNETYETLNVEEHDESAAAQE